MQTGLKDESGQLRSSKRMIEFIVWGEPEGKGRPRFTQSGRAYTPKKTRTYEAEVISSFRRDCPKFEPWERGVPLRVRIKAVYAIPESAPAYAKAKMLAGQTRPTKKPDCDNIEKIICDSLNAVCYHDDAQIVDVKCIKEYGKDPRVEVRITEVSH